MKNMKVSMKLMTSFAIAVSLTIIVGIAGILGMESMDNAAHNMYAEQATPLGELLTATDYFQRLRVQVRNAIIYSGNDEQLQTVENDMHDRMNKFETAMQNYMPSISTENGQKLYNAVSDNYYDIFKPGILNVLDGAKLGMNSQDLLAEMAGTTLAANQIAIDLSDLGQARLGVMRSADATNNALGQLLFKIIIVAIVIATVISVLFALYISGLISKPLKVLTDFMNKAGSTGEIALASDEAAALKEMAKLKDEVGQCIKSTATFVEHMTTIGKELGDIAGGDLTTNVELLSEKDTMGISLTKMVDNLNEMFREISSATDQVAAGTNQIADGSQALAQGSTEQAASIEELSSSVNDIAEKTKQNAEMAGEAAKLAETIKDNAEKGSRQMDEMMSAVKEINQASHDIGQVIKVIDDIAFQTNILALNAAVEAARAGQHGKGFAVVAEEVRNLAAKSADAAKNTGELIENSIQKADLGARIADETALSLNQIVSGINESNLLVAEIANSSENQSAGISQINIGLEQVAQVVQRNNATSEESAATSEELSGQSNLLRELVARFKLKDVVINPQHSRSIHKSSPAREVASFESDFNKASHDKY